jgi:hypothetical protein
VEKRHPALGDCIGSFRVIRSFISKGDIIVRVAENIRRENSGVRVRDYDTLIQLSYAIFSIVFVVAIYAASPPAGTAPGEFASMSVFP